MQGVTEFNLDVAGVPGSTAFVTAAKRRVYGQVGIDALAGPSEIVVVADAANRPDWIAFRSEQKNHRFIWLHHLGDPAPLQATFTRDADRPDVFVE